MRNQGTSHGGTGIRQRGPGLYSIQWGRHSEKFLNGKRAINTEIVQSEMYRMKKIQNPDMFNVYE